MRPQQASGRSRRWRITAAGVIAALVSSLGLVAASSPGSAAAAEFGDVPLRDALRQQFACQGLIYGAKRLEQSTGH
jgi:hypothetical protein